MNFNSVLEQMGIPQNLQMMVMYKYEFITPSSPRRIRVIRPET